MRRFDMRRTPHLAQQLPVGHDFAAILNQRAEQLVLQRRQVHIDSIELHAPSSQVDDEPSDLHVRLTLRAGAQRHVTLGNP